MKEMRRIRQKLSDERCMEILEKGTSGVLALRGEDYPYAVPLSYVTDGSKIYFHCAKAGYKLDLIQYYNRASFCIIEQDEIVPKEYTTYYRSVIVFGRIHIIEDEQRKIAAIERLGRKYYAEDEQGLKKEIRDNLDRLCMLELSIEEISGKEAIELVK